MSVQHYGHDSDRRRQARTSGRVHRALTPVATIFALAITMWALGTIMSMVRAPYELDMPVEEQTAPVVHVTTTLGAGR